MMKQLLRKCRRIGKILKNFPENLFAHSVIVLCYHRVEKLENDPYMLAVSPENFRSQIAFLCENFPIFRFDQPWDFAQTGFAITFDDGYADNFTHALPVLREFNVPATVFVTAGYLGGQQEFPWDGGQTPARTLYRQLSLEQLHHLADNPLITIGSHTMNHPRLTELDREMQYREIAEGHRFLETTLQRKLTTFSYPFGNYADFNADSKAICGDLGLFRAAANYPGQAHARTDALAIPRHLIRNYDAEILAKRLFRLRFL